MYICLFTDGIQRGILPIVLCNKHLKLLLFVVDLYVTRFKSTVLVITLGLVSTS